MNWNHQEVFRRHSGGATLSKRGSDCQRVQSQSGQKTERKNTRKKSQKPEEKNQAEMRHTKTKLQAREKDRCERHARPPRYRCVRKKRRFSFSSHCVSCVPPLPEGRSPGERYKLRRVRDRQPAEEGRRGRGRRPGRDDKAPSGAIILPEPCCHAGSETASWKHGALIILRK